MTASIDSCIQSGRVHKTAAAEVGDAIRGRILDGRYQANQYIREASVARELEVSRTPVREAFRELVSEGWLEAIPHRGCRVVSWTENDAREIFEIRLVLEPMAVGLACERMDPATLSLLRQLCRDMEQCADRVADQPEARNQLARLNHEFHQLLIVSSGNRRLINLLDSLVRGSVIRRNYANYQPHHLQRSMRHHDEIVQALEQGESSWAENLMRSHLLAGRRLHLEEPSVKPPGNDG